VIVRFAIFFTIFTTLIVLSHVYLYRRLVRDTVRTGPRRKVGLGIIVALAALMIGGRALDRWWPNPFTEVLATAGYVWMGVSLFLVLTLMAMGGVWRTSGLVARIRGAARTAKSGEPSVDPERRLFLARAVAGGAAALSGGIASYGAWRAFHPPEVSEVAVRLRGLPRALDGFSIVQLTDIHVGNIVEQRFLDELVRRANALRPDLVAITGDLVDGDVPTLGPAVASLSKLRSRHGTFFVTGNHDYYSGDREWTAFLESTGVEVLRNRHVRIGEPGANLDLVGVDDWSARRTGGGYDLEAAIAGKDPDRPAVLLSHQPANFLEAAKRGIGLQLSGHTHGGQIFPFTVFVGLGWEYSAGLYRAGDSVIYVSRGCGFWGPPMRVGSPPELVKIVLTA
jgi:uncharacterized protein